MFIFIKFIDIYVFAMASRLNTSQASIVDWGFAVLPNKVRWTNTRDSAGCDKNTTATILANVHVSTGVHLTQIGHVMSCCWLGNYWRISV